MDFAAQFSAYRDRVERGLDTLPPPADARPARLHAAMRYSLQAGGKRLRPVLVLAAADTVAPAGGPPADPLPAAVALECLHTYSLIHDDLPCLDNDDLRRGRPTAHRQFDEPTALLAGDALLTLAFQLLARHYPATLAHALVGDLAEAAGSGQLVGGQMADLLAERNPAVDADELRFIHRNKTGALLRAGLVLGGRCGGATAAQLEALREAGENLGLAFQIVDDLLDATGDTATLGKTAGKDARAGKTTWVALHGVTQARRDAAACTDQALAALRRLPGGGAFLVQLAGDMLDRAR